MAMEHYISADVLVQILLRLPPSSLRRARLVCRHWRDVVDERTTEMQSRPRPLIWTDRFAYAICEDLSFRRFYEELWRTCSPTVNGWHPQLVGTCNGLLCFCDNEEQVGGALKVVNPATRETLPVPPLPCGSLFDDDKVCWHAAYNFAYHPTTGKYKLVHVPCDNGRLCDFGTVQVLTLGEATWRDVLPPFGGVRCKVSAGIVSIDGMTYWVKMGDDTGIVSFDLDTECFASAATPMPRLSAKHRDYHLTEVHGRLGFVSLSDVWVLEQGRRRWSHRYKLERGTTWRHFPWPHFIYADCILKRRDDSGFYAHWPKISTRRKWGGVIGGIGRRYHGERTFAYVETTEPLGVYAVNNLSISHD